MDCKYFVCNGMEETEVKADSVAIHLSDGTKYELHFRKSDEEVSLSTNKKLIVVPVAANVVRLESR